MALSVVMPALEMAQETGKIISWLKKEGDAIRKGEPLLEIETDKIVFEIEAAADGVLAGVIGEGAVVPVGQTIAWIVAPGEAGRRILRPCSRRADDDGTFRASLFTDRGTGSREPSRGGGRARISPKARRIAQEHGVDLSKVIGTGPDGMITGEDVLKPPKHRLRLRPRLQSWSAHHSKHHCAADGRTHHAKLDPRAALFPGARSRCQRAGCSPQEREPAKFSVTDFLIAWWPERWRSIPR